MERVETNVNSSEVMHSTPTKTKDPKFLDFFDLTYKLELCQVTCRICEEPMNTAVDFYLHFQINHPIKSIDKETSWEKGVQCGVCPDISYSEASLIHHMRLHLHSESSSDPLKCELDRKQKENQRVPVSQHDSCERIPTLCNQSHVTENHDAKLYLFEEVKESKSCSQINPERIVIIKEEPASPERSQSDNEHKNDSIEEPAITSKSESQSRPRKVQQSPLLRLIGVPEGRSLDDEIGPVYCNICYFVAVDQSRLRKHLDIQHEHEDPTTAELQTNPLVFRDPSEFPPNEDWIEKWKKYHEDGLLRPVCPYCGNWRFSRYREYNRHLTTHGRAHLCSTCGKTFNTKNYLKTHFRMVHDETAQFYHCTQCDYKSKSRFHLKRHNYDRHGEGINIIEASCELCGKLFKKKSSLYTHKKVSHPEAFEEQYVKKKRRE